MKVVTAEEDPGMAGTGEARLGVVYIHRLRRYRVQGIFFLGEISEGTRGDIYIAYYRLNRCCLTTGMFATGKYGVLFHVASLDCSTYPD